MANATAIVVLETQELGALPPSKAEQIRATFLPMAAKVEEFEEDYNEIMALAAQEVTPEISARARRLRLDIAKVRVEAEKARKAIKAEYLLASQAIDGTNNILKWAISQREEALEAIEKHAERMERERLAELHAERLELIAPYVEDPHGRDYSQMEDDVWAAYLATKKKDHEDRLEAERQVEAERVAAAEAQARYIARSARVAPVFDFFPQEIDVAAVADEEFEALLATATEAKAAHDGEQERVRKENERLAAEAAKKEAARKRELAKIEKQREAERAEAEAKRKAELAAIEAERQKEREAAEAERKRLAAMEAAEAARKAKEKAEAEARAAAEAEAAKAPVRDRLNAWVDTFALPELPGEEHPKADDIRAKFEAFRKWAKTEIASI